MYTHCLLLGDMGSGEESQYRVARSMKSLIKQYPIRFVCGLGDNIYEDGCTSVNDSKFYTHFEKPYRQIPNRIKFYMCLGNHDYHITKNIMKDNFLQNNSNYQVEYGKLSQKKNKKWIMPSKYYTFTKGPIEFFVLDTNLDMLSQKEIEAQRLFMKQKIKSSTKPWRIIYGHHTWLSPGGHGNANQLLHNFLEDLCSGKRIHLYMCGHDHLKSFMTRNINNKKTHLVICGTGGKQYHKEFHPENIFKTKSDIDFYSPNLGVAHLKASRDKLIITFYNDTNQIEYTRTIQ